MPNFTAGTSFTDGVTNDVTAAKLDALVANAVPTSSLALNSTTGTIATFNSTTGTIPTLVATTLVTTGTGTAAAPAIVPTGDTNTGIFFPAADTIAFSEGGAEAMRIFSNGNAAIGTTSASGYRLNIEGNSASVGVGISLNDTNASGRLHTIRSDEGTFAIYDGTAGADRLRIDSSGNVGVGTTSPINKLHLYNGTISVGATQLELEGRYNGYGAGINFSSRTSDGGTLVTMAKITADGEASWNTTGTEQDAGLRFSTTANGTLTERLRIDSSGNLLVGTTDTSFSAGVGLKFRASATAPIMGYVMNTAGVETSYNLFNTNATNNGFRFYVNTNGGISNFSGNNVNLSDERLKTNINLSGNYLDKICSIPVKTFNYKDQGEDTEKTIGVLAQEVEVHIPELINNDGFGETPADGIPLKTIYQTDLQYVLMRCIQELKSENNSLKSRIEALEAA